MRISLAATFIGAAGIFGGFAMADSQDDGQTTAQSEIVTPQDKVILANTTRLLERGRNIFRYDTFGDEAFWGRTLRLHLAIAGERFGGVGAGLSPKKALKLGLKVDRDALPQAVRAALKAGQVDLDDPASTLLLLKANAVVGLTGHFNRQDQLTSLGVQCAYCHIDEGRGGRQDFTGRPYQIRSRNTSFFEAICSGLIGQLV